MDHPDVRFLKDEEISKILTKGLSQLYQKKPEKPIDYLAKWLLNINEIQKKEKKNQLERTKKGDFLSKLRESENQKQQELQTKEEQKKRQDFDDQMSLSVIFEDNYLPEQLNKNVPNFLKEKLSLPACYIAHLDYKKQSIGAEDDQPLAHLNLNDQKVLHYIGASDNHEFLLNQTLDSSSFTYKIFETKESEDNSQQLNKLYVSDVTQENSLHFFRIPKLGAYMATNLDLKSYFNDQSFDSGVKEKLEFNENMKLYEQEKQTLETNFEAKKELGEESEEYQQAKTEYEEALENLQKPELPEYAFEVQRYVLCVDTMGQDREIDESTQDYLKQISEKIQKAWETTSKRILSEDIDRFVNYQQALQELEAYQENAELSEQENKAAQFEFLTNQLTSEAMRAQIKLLSQYRVLKFPSVLQGVLYLLGHKREDINVENTNELNWKHVASLVTEEAFFESLKTYEYKGAKTNEFPDYAKLNRLSKRTDEHSDVLYYNQAYALLYTWFHLAIEMRKQNIQQRKDEKQALREERNELIRQKEERDQKKLTDLEAAQESLSPEELETFNQENWEQEWEAQNQTIDIPEEVINDIDNDLESD